jgi:hypothetical protein
MSRMPGDTAPERGRLVVKRSRCENVPTLSRAVHAGYGVPTAATLNSKAQQDASPGELIVKLSNSVLSLWVAVGTLLVPALPARADDADNSTASSPVVATDNSLQFRVSSALHSDPYLYARHIDVYVKDGDVVLKGSVANDWELSKALHLATEAAKPHKVIDSIEITEGGRR